MIRKHIILLFTAEILSTGILLSQPSIEWFKLYPVISHHDTLASYCALDLDQSGNVLVTGLTIINNKYHFCTIKYSAFGAQEWVRFYAGYNNGGRIPYSIAVDKSSNVYVTGYDYFPGNYFDYCTIKYDSNGVQQWVRYYDGPVHGNDEARKVAVDIDGNIYVFGFSTIHGSSGFAYTTIKYSSDGNIIWIKTFGIPSTGTEVEDMKVDNNCNVYVTGMSNYRAVTVKYDSLGKLLWSNEYPVNRSGLTWAKSLALDKNFNVCVAGYTEEGAITESDFFVIKYSPAGITEWVRTFNDDSTVYSTYMANSVGTDSTGSVYVNGVYRSFQGAAHKLLTIKYSNSGELIWYRKEYDTLGGQNSWFTVDHLGSAYSAASYGSVYPLSNVMMIKYDSSGRKLWTQSYIDTFSTTSFIKVDEKLNIYITGARGTPTYGNNAFTVKYNQLTGIKTSNASIPVNFKLYQNYPNPFNPITKIQYSIPQNGDVSLKVYDMLGREVQTLVNGYKKAGDYSVIFDGSKLSSGVYIYKLQAEQYSDMKKMVLIK
jgi:hypothetical protein